ncbi:hypothetical protein BDU57DRAFT_344374 [Ampelomyces quisqualis]|uniref:Uncharacterized protein n=1 Tax=Ampelomyces quisqualis TaxID=50730 RepID=A0A6A5QBV3_AMPQU|nr:hypothetical protein BDU57DRAFT_344374 [Ampelomyces quisqualis]
MSFSIVQAAPQFTTPFARLSDRDDIYDIGDFQSIPGTCIDAGKLLALLRMKFGAGTYDMHIIQNSYCVAAPRKLSRVSHARPIHQLIANDV